jgi:putative SOS response-associated peptidase YedK
MVKIRYTIYMTERYTLYHLNSLKERFSIDSDVSTDLKPQYNISPTQLSPVIVSRDGENYLMNMKWGFVPESAKDMNSVFRYKTYTVKSETIFDKPTLETAVRRSRCLVPSTGYYEWRKTKAGKLPYFVRPADQEVFAFAGICSNWTDPQGVVWGMYSIITTIASPQLELVSRRMPVILKAEDNQRWLDSSITDAGTLYDMMRTYENDKLIIQKVSDAVNSTKSNSPKLIQPID